VLILGRPVDGEELGGENLFRKFAGTVDF